MLFSKLKMNVDDFHPTLRAGFAAELERINRDAPIFTKLDMTVKVQDNVDPEDFCECGSCKPKKLTAYAMTSINTKNLTGRIYFRSEWFGANGDPGLLQKQFLLDGHENVNPPCVLAHEWGHVIMAMLTFAFAGKNDSATGQAYHRLMVRVMDLTSISLLPMLLGTSTQTPLLVQKNGAEPLVSDYAYINQEEFFAETYACVYYGDEKQKALSTTVLMKDLINTVYGEVRKWEVPDGCGQ